MRVRPPSAGDAAALAELLGELGYPATPEAVVERLSRLAGQTGVVVLVAENEGEPAGLATGRVANYINVDPPVAEVTALVVSSRHRGLGIGRRLVEAVEAWAAGEGAYRVAVSSGLAREGAHAFYERLGYEHTGRRYAKLL